MNRVVPYFGLYKQCGSLLWAVTTVWFVTLDCINSVVSYFGQYQESNVPLLDGINAV